MNSSPATEPLRGAVSESRYLAALESERATWWSSENFDTWKKLYVSEYDRGRYVVDTLREYALGFDPAGADVLDIGCGDGGALIAFAELGAQCAGIETNLKSIGRARIRADEHGVAVAFQPGSAEALPFADESFDLVMLDNVLEHVSDRDQTLREIHRVLRPGGIFYAVTPKPLALYALWNDPHYDLAGLVLMPRRMQILYFERIRGGGKGSYDVGVIPTRRAARRLLKKMGFELIASPRDLWIRYLRYRISRPEEIRPGIKRKVAERVMRMEWPFRNRLVRAFWDILVGSNYFIARRAR
jgi:ubiquinone/menaquinone biosynthesis C-methylase UbiE